MSHPDTVPGTAVSLSSHPSAPGQGGTAINQRVTRRHEGGAAGEERCGGGGDLTFLKDMKMP